MSSVEGHEGGGKESTVVHSLGSHLPSHAQENLISRYGLRGPCAEAKQRCVPLCAAGGAEIVDRSNRLQWTENGSNSLKKTDHFSPTHPLTHTAHIKSDHSPPRFPGQQAVEDEPAVHAALGQAISHQPQDQLRGVDAHENVLLTPQLVRSGTVWHHLEFGNYIGI